MTGLQIKNVLAAESNSIVISNDQNNLGLIICKKLCQQLGGKLAVYTSSNEGNTIVFTIKVNSGGIANDVNHYQRLN